MANTIRLPKENLYSDGFIIYTVEGYSLLKRNRFNYLSKNPDDRIHPIIEGENIWNIAFKYYGNSKWWHVLCDVNNIENPFELPEGESLLIPDLSTVIAGR